MGRLLSEDHVLGLIDSFFPNAADSIAVGRGDDCAVIRTDKNLCISTDLFLEDVHFRRSYFRPEEIGARALAVNVSDLAGSGAEPLGFTLGLALPPKADSEFLCGILRGMAGMAAWSGISLVGGDLSSAERLHFCITVFGRADHPFLRRQAVPEDVIFYVPGTPLGLAALGLKLLEEKGRADAEGLSPRAVAAHLRPEPCLGAARRLRSFAERHDLFQRIGLMDVSDGLARDLPRLIGKNRGASIKLENPDAELLRHEAETGESAFKLMLSGGEAYGLLGTCPKSFFSDLQSDLPETCPLGLVRNEPFVTVNGRILPPDSGFDHFSFASAARVSEE
ncbi:MAG: thiamine-phosphate kinase [Desulfovibrionaceae bacterium]|nr:thiamine-phosphate kinase [Desulfovibrionaceae bacterium]